VSTEEVLLREFDERAPGDARELRRAVDRIRLVGTVTGLLAGGAAPVVAMMSALILGEMFDSLPLTVALLVGGYALPLIVTPTIYVASEQLVRARIRRELGDPRHERRALAPGVGGASSSMAIPLGRERE
jgi:hypothetical protein